MQARRINNCSTTARFRVEFTEPEDYNLTTDEIADLLVPYNYGARREDASEDGSYFTLAVFQD